VKISTRRRLRVPTVMAIVGTATAAATFIGRGLGSAVGFEIWTVLLTVGYYKLGARDSDFGAMMGSRTDERQAQIKERAAALSAIAMIGVAGIGYAVVVALKEPSWPFLLFSYVGVGAFLGSWFVLQRRR